jgi:hypothetical protein
VSNSLTVVRAQDGSSANSFQVGALVAMRVNAASVTDYNQGGIGAVTRTIQSRLRDFVSVKDFGAVGDGVTDDTAAFQDAVDSGAGRVHVPDGTYLLSSLVTITSPMVMFGSGTIKEDVLREATILVDNTDDVGFDGLTFEGPENLANWVAGGAVHRQAYRAFIKFDTCNRGFVKNTRSSGKRTTVWARNCNNMRVEGNYCEGFFGTVAGGGPGDANWAPAYFMQGGVEHQLSNNEARENGSVVLIGLESSYNTVINTVGKNNHDNGVYNSSGNYSSFMGGTFESPGGSGLKIRGRAHVVSGFTIRDTNTLAAAISLTGNGLVPDAYNANGFGTVCIGNTLEKVRGVGIQMGGQDGFFARDFVIANNTIEDHTPGLTTEAAILISATRGVKVIGNTISSSSGADYAIGIFGPGGGTAPYLNRGLGFDVSNNTVSNTSSAAMRVQNVDKSLINNNLGENLGSVIGIEFRLCDDNFISGNRMESATITLSSALGQECLNNTATDNDVLSYSGTDQSANVTALPINYRIGVWSATYTTTGTDFGSVTYTDQQSSFTKVGRLVTVSGHIQTSAITVGGATGNVVIGGLPFATSNAGTGVRGSGSVNSAGFAGDTPIGLRVDRNTSVLRPTYRSSIGGDDLLLEIADLATGSGNRIYFTCTYTTDA